MHTMIPLCPFILVLFACNNVTGMDTDCTTPEVMVLRAVRGREARLPCGQGKVFLDGPASYVLWLKNDRDFLYRFPNQDAEKRTGTRDYIFGTSCESGICHYDTSLLIKNVTERDGGLYRCIVHYQASPSIDYVIEVRLVNSPGMPRLYNGDGDPIKLGFVGPLSLGSNLKLICEVADQDPETQVYWRLNGAVVKGAHVSRPGVMRVEIHLFNLSRAELDLRYECLSQNADVSGPLTASVVVKMYLPPLSVEIRLNNNFEFEAGQPRVVDCVVIGCVPPPAITWHLGNNMVRPTVHKELNDGNYTVSSLTLAPSLHDHRKVLVCRAQNFFMPSKVFQDKVTLNVGFRPICQSCLEKTIGAVVREAETVTCVVDSSPEPLQFSWTFADSKTLYTSVTKVDGHHHRYSSTLTWISREGDIGMLLGRATNAFGEQKNPCTYKITFGGPPEPPTCNPVRIYPNSLRVQCKKGWDGGRPQTIHLEIRDEDGTSLKNITDLAGHFYLSNVVENRNVTAVMYATNTRGKSEEKIIYLQSLTPQSEAANNNIPNSWMACLEALAGTVALTFAVTSIVLGTKILIARRERAQFEADLVPRNDGAFHREPDFVREERLLGTTNITVNQLATRQNQYSSSPLPACRVLVGYGPHSPPDTCPSSPYSYYV